MYKIDNRKELGHMYFLSWHELAVLYLCLKKNTAITAQDVIVYVNTILNEHLAFKNGFYASNVHALLQRLCRRGYLTHNGHHVDRSSSGRPPRLYEITPYGTEQFHAYKKLFAIFM